MNGFFETVFLTLFRPALASQERIQKRYWWQAALLVWLSTTLVTFSLEQAAPMGLRLAVSWLSSLLLWWLGSLMLHFCADLFGGKGRFADMMTGTGLAVTPLILSAPLAALPNLLGNFGHTLSLLAWMGLSFWVLALLALNLSRAESFSLDRSLGTLILSGAFSAALLFALGLLGLLQIFLWGAMLQA